MPLPGARIPGDSLDLPQQLSHQRVLIRTRNKSPTTGPVLYIPTPQVLQGDSYQALHPVVNDQDVD